VRYPIRLERQLRSLLKARQRRIRARVLAELRVEYKRVDSVPSVLAAAWNRWIAPIAFRIRAALGMEPVDLRAIARAIDANVSRQVARGLAEAPIKSMPGVVSTRTVDRALVPLESVLREWGKVTSAKVRLFEELAIDAAVASGSIEGATASLDASAARVSALARDSTSKLVSSVVRERSANAGVSGYRWISMRDERVRPVHRRLDGTVRRWDDPHPTEVHPGYAYGCRCVAAPIRLT